MIKHIQNKRGDIPITILVIGVITVCILTLYSFSFSLRLQYKNFAGPGLIETIYSIQEELWLDKTKNFGQYSDYENFEFTKDGKVAISVNRQNNIIHGNYSISQGFFTKRDNVIVEITYKYDD